MMNKSSSSSLSSLSTSSFHTQTPLSCTASLNLMPDSDTDSVVNAMEGTGTIDPTVIAATPKKRRAKKKNKSHKRRKSFGNTGSETSTNHSVSGVRVEEAPIQQVFSEEPNNDVAATTDQVAVAVPVPTQTSYQKKKQLFWSFSIDPDLPNFLIDDNNYQGKPLIRCIIQDSPWRAKHGAKKTSWESVMSLLADQQLQFEKVFEGPSLITV